MQPLSITARVPAKKAQPAEGDKPAVPATPEMTATVPVPFPETAKEAIDVYSDTAVLSNMRANATVVLQALVRSRLRNKKTVKDIEKELVDWKMGISTRKISDPVESSMKTAENMSDEQIDDLMAKLRKKKAERDTKG